MSHLFVGGIFISLFLVLILLTKSSKKTPDYILAALLFFSAQTIFNTFWVVTGQYIRYPDLLTAGLNSPIIIPPLFYLYSKYQTRNIRFQQTDLLHLAPFAICFLLYVKFFFYTDEEKLALIAQNGVGELDIVRVAATYLSGFIYFLLSLYTLLGFRRRMKHLFSNTEKIEFNWLVFLISGMLCVWLVVWIVQDDSIISVSSTIFILLLGYFGITQVNVFSGDNAFFKFNTVKAPPHAGPPVDSLTHVEGSRYKNSLLSEDEADKIHAKLIEVLAKERPYLNPELTLGQLAQLLNVHPNKLSEVINSKEAKTFYDLINELRINEFLKLVIVPENRQYTFMSLAYDCGFNSKASFNRNFKKHTGSTPSEYLSRHVASQSE